MHLPIDPWRLPGPAHLVRRLARSVCAGQNVVATVAESHSEGLGRAVEQARGSLVTWPAPWLPCALPEAPVVDRVAATLMLEGGEPTPWHIAHHGGKHGQQVVHAELTPDEWPAWRDFLYAYAQACQQEDPDTRPVLFVTVADLPPETLGHGEPTLEVFDARQPWTDRDVRVYLWYALAGSATSPRDELVAELIVETAVLMARGNLAEAHEFAHQGRRLLSRLEVGGPLWKAQVRVLFPLIEEARARMAREAARILGGRGGADDIEVLEIGPLHHRLVKLDAPRRLVEQARALREMRNSLAHRRPIPLGDLHRLVPSE